ncbi:hypothetical protein AX15_003349 [Amanita polypyramis BW_CC]|nr:hypothetical protein AX15_003349 [Amanita polypyramis BW_CC]
MRSKKKNTQATTSEGPTGATSPPPVAPLARSRASSSTSSPLYIFPDLFVGDAGTAEPRKLYNGVVVAQRGGAISESREANRGSGSNQINRNDKGVVITRPTGPGEVPTIAMTARPPSGDKKSHSDMLMIPPLYGSNSVVLSPLPIESLSGARRGNTIITALPVSSPSLLPLNSLNNQQAITEHQLLGHQQQYPAGAMLPRPNQSPSTSVQHGSVPPQTQPSESQYQGYQQQLGQQQILYQQSNQSQVPLAVHQQGVVSWPQAHQGNPLQFNQTPNQMQPPLAQPLPYQTTTQNYPFPSYHVQNPVSPPPVAHHGNVQFPPSQVPQQPAGQPFPPHFVTQTQAFTRGWQQDLAQILYGNALQPQTTLYQVAPSGQQQALAQMSYGNMPHQRPPSSQVLQHVQQMGYPQPGQSQGPVIGHQVVGQATNYMPQQSQHYPPSQQAPAQNQAPPMPQQQMSGYPAANHVNYNNQRIKVTRLLVISRLHSQEHTIYSINSIILGPAKHNKCRIHYNIWGNNLWTSS